MGPRWRYLFGEVVAGLRRNLLMTIATIVTVTVSLAVLGAGYLTWRQVEKAKDVYYAEVEVSIFLSDAITEEQRQTLERDLNANPLVADNGVIYESKEEAYQNARRIFESDPVLMESLRPDQLPASFRVKLTDAEQFDVVASQFEQYPGIDEVVDQREFLELFFVVMNNAVAGAIGVAILQLLGAAALVSNTIRLTAFARREQTGIMKLVGATNWYIRLPFMVEGIVAGVLGALIASGLLLLGDVILLSRVKQEIRVFPFITTGEVATVVWVLLAVGILVAGLASFLSLRRFLDV